MPSKGYVVFFLLLNFCSAFAQNIITDSIFIEFETDSIITQNYLLDTVVDKRTEHSRVVSYSQSRKFYLIPIDQEICLKNPLPQYLQKSNNAENNLENNTYQINIDYFLIDQYKGKFFKQYRLLADLSLYQLVGDTLSFKGTLSYNFEYQPKVRKPKSSAVEKILPEWHRKFKIDMLTTSSYLKSKQDKPENFLVQQIKRPYFMSVSTGAVYGYKFWQVEGELNLSRPETSTNNWNMSSIVRYQKTEDFELFAYGKKSEHYNKRYSENWKLDINSNLLLGFVKWQETEEIKLYQLFQISLSSAQSICYDRKNQPGFLFKAGLFENIYYIVEKPFGLQVGLYLSTGYKF